MTQTSPIRPESSLAQLAAAHAGASRVFARHGLDFCCHGQESLREACARKEFDLELLVGEIEAEQRGDEPVEPWEVRPMNELVDHIITRFHQPLRAELPRLTAMARRVEAVHGEKPECPRGLTRLLDRVGSELTLHMEKEEQVLFPMLSRGAGAMAAGPIRVMEQEHGDHGTNLATIRRLVTDFAPPECACGTWRALYVGLAELELEVMRHIHLENHVLFPRALRA